MPFKKSQRIENCQIVGMRNQKGLLAKEILVCQDGSSRAQQLLFMDDHHILRPTAASDIVNHQRRKIMGVDEDFADSVPDQRFEPVVKQRPAMDGNQALGQVVGQGLESGAQACGKK